MALFNEFDIPFTDGTRSAYTLYEMKDKIIELCKKKTDRKLVILDIGCGACRDHPHLKEISELWLKENNLDDIRVIIMGLDKNKEGLRQTRRGEFKYYFASAMGEEECRQLDLIVGDGCSLPIKSDSVDVVMSSCVLVHLMPEEIMKLKAEVQRVVRRGGITSLW